MEKDYPVVDIRYQDVSKFPFMSEEWSKAMHHNIMYKMENDLPLTRLEEAFISLQNENITPSDRWEKELSNQEYKGGKQLLTSNMELSNNGLLE